MFALFDLSGPANYSFTGTITGDTDLNFIGTPSDPADGNSINVRLNSTGVLPAGEYYFNTYIASLGLFSSPSSFDFDFQVEVVPEPSSLCFLMSAAFVGIVKRRRAAK